MQAKSPSVFPTLALFFAVLIGYTFAQDLDSLTDSPSGFSQEPDSNSSNNDNTVPTGDSTSTPDLSTSSDASTSIEDQDSSSSTSSDSSRSSQKTTSTTAMPTTIVTMTTTPAPTTNGTLQDPAYASNPDNNQHKLRLAPGGIIAVSVLGAFMLGTLAFIVLRALRARHRRRALKERRISKVSSITTADSTAAVPLFTESSPRSSAGFSPISARQHSADFSVPSGGNNKPLPTPPNSSKDSLRRFISKGKRPVYAPTSRLSFGSQSRPSPLRRQFSFDLEEEANHEVMQSAGLYPPSPTVMRNSPLTSNPVRPENHQPPRYTPERRQSSRDSFPESLRTGSPPFPQQRFPLD